MNCRLASTLLVLSLALSSNALAANTWYVDGVHGNDHNNCKSPQHACKTIGHAISLAHSGDSVMVAPATYKENLTISITLKMIGSGARTTIIDGGGGGTVVTISNASAHVTLSKLTIQNGLAQSGGGIANSGTLTITSSTISGNSAGGGAFGSGGGIASSGPVTINKSTISGNGVAGRFGGSGGGIAGGPVTINNSTVSGNVAGNDGVNGYGGGIVGGPITINNSTVSGNVASLQGGGIGNFSGGQLAINNSTVSGNSAGDGGGIYNTGTATFQNSIVANSSSGGNCSGTMTSKGYNLSSDGTCNFNGPGDLNNTDPKLGTLGNYGGPTQTIPLLAGSPAVDAGNPNGCTDGNGHVLKTDQRGKPRPDQEDSGGCDMGAFERQKD